MTKKLLNNKSAKSAVSISIKKIIFFVVPIVILAMTLMLSSCGKKDNDNVEVSESHTEETSESSENKKNDSKTKSETKSKSSTTSEQSEITEQSDNTEQSEITDKAVNSQDSDTQVYYAVETSNENGIAISYASYFLGHGSDTYKANCPGIVSAEFVVMDTEHSYDTGFECWIEGYDTKKGWYKLKPIGDIVQVNNNSGHFHNFDEEATSGVGGVYFDLACYPLLPAGKYRIAKPFWEEGSTNHEQYIVYYDFEMVDNLDTGDEIKGTITCLQSEYPINTTQIKLESDGIFAQSEIFDIERKVGANWQSVRKSSVRTNAIGGSYGLLFSDVIDTDGFDLSKAGEYRLRISVGEMTSDFDFLSNYDTKYAYFKITDSADIGDISISCALKDVCEIDKELPVNVTSFVNSSAELKKAVLSVGGKTIEGYGNLSLYPNSSTYNFYDPSTYDSNSTDETIISFKENLPAGSAELKLTFSAEGCKDKIVTTKFKIRNATKEEKNSGVLLTTKDCGLSPEKITVKITNKLRSKKAINISNDNFYVYTIVDDQTVYAYMFNQSNNKYLTINYGDTAEVVLTNYGKDLKNYCKLFYDFSDDESEYIDELIKEVEKDEYYKYSCLAEAGTYTVSVNYFDDDNNTEIAESTFKIK